MKRLLPVLLCLGLVGCVTMSTQMNSLRVGMTKDEVIKVMGEPLSTSAKESLEYLNYALTETNQQLWGGQTTPYFVAFKNGKVIGFGRTGDFGTTAKPKEIIELNENITSTHAGGNGELEDKLKTLNKLLTDGLITQDEFNARKKALLDAYATN